MKNIAVVLAGGSGKRVGGEIPKQLQHVQGKPLIEWSIKAFSASSLVDEVLVVSSKNCLSELNSIKDNYPKWQHTIEGGSERFQSSYKALSFLKDKYEEANVLIHDAARPVISADLIKSIYEALESSSAVIPAVPVDELILEVEDGRLTDIPDRKKLFRAQTPQGFKLSLIANAYENYFKLIKKPHVYDDGSVFRLAYPNLPISIIAGDVKNIKVTRPKDLSIAESYLKDNI